MITGKMKEIPLGGLTSALSDYDCVDGEMQICHNMISDGAGLKPIADVEVKLTLPEGVNGVVFTHHTSVGVVYIVYDSGNSKLEYGDADRIVLDSAGDAPSVGEETIGDGCRFILPTGFTLEEGKYSLSSVGNVLVLNVSYDDGDGLSANNGLHYFLCKNRKTYGAVYEYLGQRPPDVGLVFKLRYPRKTIEEEMEGEGNTWEHRVGKLKGATDALCLIFSEGYEEIGWATLADIFSGTISAEETVSDDYQLLEDEKVKNAVMASVNEHVADCKKRNRYLQPFFVRYAYRLYDGSYIMQSSPVLMVPDCGLNPFVYLSVKGFGTSTLTYNGYLLSRPMELMFTTTISDSDKKTLDKWKDVIQGVGVFITPQIPCYAEDGLKLNMASIARADENGGLYDTWLAYTADGEPLHNRIFHGGTFQPDCSFKDADEAGVASFYEIRDTTEDISENSTDALQYTWNRFIGGGFEREGSAEDWVREGYVFYELKELALDECEADMEFTRLKRDGGVENLDASTQLTDGYHERTLKHPKFIHAYNGRLNIANVDEKEMATMQNVVTSYTAASQGLVTSAYSTPAPAYDAERTHKIKGTFTVYIESGGIVNKVSFEVKLGFFDSMPGFFFYPNPDAKYLRFEGEWIKGEDSSTDIDWWWKLQPHPSLHGAYYFKGYYGYLSDYAATRPSETTAWEEGWIHQTNYLYASEVDNPFMFPASGVEAVGNGEITAIKEATKAVSEGTAFGQMPLYAFCTDGIWALEVGSTGTYTAKQAVSRETLLGGDADCATQIDDSILFLSDRGLMELSGGRTRLLSGALQGRDNISGAAYMDRWDEIHEMFNAPIADGFKDADDFIGFIKEGGARIAFDYESYRAVIYRSGEGVAYVYDIGAGAWATMDCRIKSSLEGFPSTLLNLERTDGKTDVGAFTLETDAPIGDGMAFYLTRPLKLGSADTLKTVRTLVERGVRSGDGEKYLALWGSRDMRRWALVAAVKGGRIPRLGGTPFKWFAVGGWTRFTAVGERISRLTLESVDRQTDKIR